MSRTVYRDFALLLGTDSVHAAIIHIVICIQLAPPTKVLLSSDSYLMKPEWAILET